MDAKCSGNSPSQHHFLRRLLTITATIITSRLADFINLMFCLFNKILATSASPLLTLLFLPTIQNLLLERLIVRFFG